MNILLITPGLNKKYNDNYHSYKFISKNNNNVLAISNRENINKGGGIIDNKTEIDGSFIIERLFKSKSHQQSFFKRLFYRKKINNLLKKFRPDVIFCEEISNLRFSLEIKNKYKVPLVLRTEFAYNPNFPYRTMGRLLNLFKNPLTGDVFPKLIGKAIWNWAYSNSDAVISCYFDDATKEPSINGTPFYFIPWPCHLPKIEEKIVKKKDQAVFIGAFDHHKNLEELSSTIPKLLKNSPLKKFLFIGDGDGIGVIEGLKQKFPESVHHIRSLSRKDCLKLIKESFFSYSPAKRGGWGFISDSWAMGTPLVVTHNHYNFQNRIDTVLTTKEEIVDRVNILYEDSSEYERLSTGGYKRFFDNHAADAVGASFLEVCTSTIKPLN